MKKNMVFFSTAIITFSLTAYGFMNWNDPVKDSHSVTNQQASSGNKVVGVDPGIWEIVNPYTDFFYAVGPRFAPIKKGDLDNARSIVDILPNEPTQSVVSYKSVSVIIIKNDRQTDQRALGKNDVLTDNQIKLLRSATYSTNFLIRADYLKQNWVTGQLEDNYFSPHFTIVPEKQANYVDSQHTLLEYLIQNNKENTVHLDENKLRPAKLYFTVSKKGVISNVRLDRTCGYPSIDKAMMELLTKAPGKWEPAENSKGKKVDQELVISFGSMGC